MKNKEGEVYHISEDNLDMFHELMMEHDLVIQQNFANEKLRIKLKNFQGILSKLGLKD